MTGTLPPWSPVGSTPTASSSSSTRRIRRTLHRQTFSYLDTVCQRGAGQPEPGPGQHQERLGGGHQNSHRRRLRRRLQKLAGALQNVHSSRRRVRQKILRNKHPPSSHRCLFIYRFTFVSIHTSYMFNTYSLVS